MVIETCHIHIYFILETLCTLRHASDVGACRDRAVFGVTFQRGREMFLQRSFTRAQCKHFDAGHVAWLHKASLEGEHHKQTWSIGFTESELTV